MFEKKTDEQLKAMNSEELHSFYMAKLNHEKEELEKRVKSLEADSSNADLAKEVKELRDTQMSTLKSALKEQGIVLEKLRSVSFDYQNDDKTTLKFQLESNSEDLKSISKGLSGKEVVIKADTLRVNVTGNQNALELQGLGQLAHAKLTAYDLFNRIPISENNDNGVIRYYDWDQATIVRAAAAVKEGVLFPESTAKWVTKTLNIEKIGDTLPVSEEFFEDSAMFAAELGMFLDTNVRIKRNNALVNGTGVAPEIKGIVTTVGAFTAIASGITDASIYDLLVKVSEDITASGGSKYTPNFGMMNIIDINKMKLKKDANNNYIIPPFVNREGTEVSGIIILEENDITANTMVVGDSRYARIYEKVGITLSRGVVNAQFAEDMETLKVRTRLAFLIRGADVGGFRKIGSISADLVTLAS